MKFICDKGVGEIKLKQVNKCGQMWNKQYQSQSQLQYLKNLQKGKEEAYKEICPVCTEEVGPHRVILACGHSFCEGYHFINDYF